MLHRMMRGVIVDGVTWESCRARVSSSRGTPLRIEKQAGWEGRGPEGCLLCWLVSILHLGSQGFALRVSWFEAQLEEDLGLRYL